MMGSISFLAIAAIVTGIGAYTDYRTGHIPNWVTLYPLAAAPLAHFFWGALTVSPMAGLAAAGLSIGGAVACAVVPLLLYRAGAIGGGDVKLLAAVGALCTPLLGVEAEFYGFLAAALYAPARMAWEGKLLRILGNTLALVANPFLPVARRRDVSPEMMTQIRFGPAIFAGVVVALALNWKMR
jgi:prepilin peptidase CpaA